MGPAVWVPAPVEIICVMCFGKTVSSQSHSPFLYPGGKNGHQELTGLAHPIFSQF